MDDGNSILNLANLDILESKYDSAIINAKKAVELSPSDGVTNAVAGIIFSRSGFYLDSITYF